jgi:OOP family OmpA-OmpF porin
MNKLMLGLLLASSAFHATAQTTDIKGAPQNAYGQASNGTILRSGSGLCWRSGTWTSTDALAGCDGKLAPPIANRIAPEIVSSAEKAVPAAPFNRCDFAVTLESDQTFAFNKALLSTAAKKRLDQDVLSTLATCSTIKTIKITGYTDRIGDAQSNRELSLKRAAAVAAYLKANGTSTKIELIGAGEMQALTQCENTMVRAKLIACLAPNRRVLIETRGIQK